MKGQIKHMRAPLKDGDTVVITLCGKLEVGIYFNNRVLTLKDGRININSLTDILVINSTPEIQEVINEIKQLYKDELNNKEKEITVNDFKTGTVLETKQGKKWLYLGEKWKLASTARADKTGRLFISMEYIDKKLTLKENLDNLILKCNSLDDMYKYFKFSAPKAIKVDDTFSYTEENIVDHLCNGLIGVVNQNKSFSFLLNASYERDTYKDIAGLTITMNYHRNISRVFISSRAYNKDNKLNLNRTKQI